MSNIVFKITQAGLNATVNNSGVAVNIAKIGFGTGAYTPTGDETTLREQQDIINLDSGVKAGNQITIEARLTGNQDYIIHEVGVFLEDGTLFALYSHATNVIAHKSKGADFQFVYVLNLSGVNASKIDLKVQGIGTADIHKNTNNITNLAKNKADLGGSSTQTFKVGSAISNEDAVNKAYVDDGLIEKLDISDFVFSNSINGYHKLPSGIIIQWATAEVYGNSRAYFPITFPTACLVVVTTENEHNPIAVTDFQVSSFSTVRSTSSMTKFYYIAIGY